jgi:hypothetical protein
METFECTPKVPCRFARRYGFKYITLVPRHATEATNT